MNIEAIYHRPKNNYAFPVNENHLQIRLRTKKNDVQTVHLIYGDPYDWKNDSWQAKEVQMKKSGTTTLYDYWVIEVESLFKRMRYAFKCTNKEHTIYYSERGINHWQPTDISYYFCFPYIHKNELFQAPTWVKNTVWYQIFPERFANGDPTINPKNTLAWGSTEPTATNFFGGDIQGIINHLDYLVDLGINGIYLTPIFKAKSNHKYDTIDYLEIDSQFGDKKTFKKFISLCHEKGIKVMLDAVFNHSGFYFEPFQDVLEKGEASVYKDWFHFWDFPVETEPKANYDTFAFEASMPKLNTKNKEVKNYLLQVAKYWIEEFDIDGWRLDVANEVDHTFWQDFRRTVKNIKKDVYILGEIWHDAQPWLQGDQFDAVMNYPFTNNVVDFFAKNSITATQFAERMTEVIHMYSTQVNEVAFNLVDSHDTPRILTLAQGDIQKVKLIYLFQMLFNGTPCIYYGGEVGMVGDHDPGCRACMIWEENNQNKSLYTFIKAIIHLRKTKELFTEGSHLQFIDMVDDEKTIAFERTSQNEKAIVIINTNINPVQLKNTFSKNFIELQLDGEQFIEALTPVSDTLTIEANNYKILYKNYK